MSRWVHYFHLSQVTSLKYSQLGSNSFTSIAHFTLGKLQPQLTLRPWVLNMEFGVVEPYPNGRCFYLAKDIKLTQASILSDITLLDTMCQAQLRNLEVHVKTLFMPKLGIVVIRLWIPYLCPLRHCGYQHHEHYGDLTFKF